MFTVAGSPCLGFTGHWLVQGDCNWAGFLCYRNLAWAYAYVTTEGHGELNHTRISQASACITFFCLHPLSQAASKVIIKSHVPMMEGEEWEPPP